MRACECVGTRAHVSTLKPEIRNKKIQECNACVVFDRECRKGIVGNRMQTRRLFRSTVSKIVVKRRPSYMRPSSMEREIG